METIKKPQVKPCRRRHDWRLLSRKYQSQPYYVPLGWNEVWYCTRCRHVEELFVPK